MYFMKKKIILTILFIIIMIFICYWLYSNTGLKKFEKEISSFILPEGIEKVTIKSGIGDSGGNGEYSTYRVVLVVKSKMPIEQLNQEFEKQNLTFSSHIENSSTPICYITHCEDSIFKSERNFILEFDELKKVKDFTGYYFIEFIK